MFERFTDRTRRVVVLAQEEARMLNHSYVGVEHLLLGLIHEGEGVAAKTLESLGISLEAVRQQVEEIIGQGQQAPSGHIPFTPRAKKVLELSLQEAQWLGHDRIGTEHILLGLIREGDGVAAQVLVKLGADLNRVRQQVIQLLHGYQGKEPAAAGAGQREQELVADILIRINAIESRLLAVEQRVGTGPAAHYRSLVRLAALLVRDVATAEEVVQDSFIAMHTAWRRLPDNDKALSYLRQSVVNRSRSVLRHRGGGRP
jgi:ATP-dependent Clp protease ATP-binding subunit ClpA